MMDERKGPNSNEISALVLKTKRAEIGPLYKGPNEERGKFNGFSINGPNQLNGLASGRDFGLTSNGPEPIGMSSKGPSTNGSSQKQRSRPWCEHCRKPGHKEDTCWDLHGKPVEWKPSQNTRSRGYQAEAKIHHPQNGAFNPEQLEQLYQIFSSLQTSGQSLPTVPSSSLAHKGNF